MRIKDGIAPLPVGGTESILDDTGWFGTFAVLMYRAPGTFIEPIMFVGFDTGYALALPGESDAKPARPGPIADESVRGAGETCGSLGLDGFRAGQ